MNVNLQLPGVGGSGFYMFSQYLLDVAFFFSFIALTTSFLATALKNFKV